MTTLVLPQAISDQLLELTKLDFETGAVLLTRMVRTPTQGLRFLGTELVLVPDHAYRERNAFGILVTSDGFVPPLRRAEETSCVPFWVHTHPGDGASPGPSKRDVKVNSQLSQLFRLRANAEYYGHLIVSSTGDALHFTAAIEDERGETLITRLWMVGARFSLAIHAQCEQQELSAVFDRNIRAFGGGVQRVLHELRVGIVGSGGTGSSIAEQLVRLGVRRLILIDPDSLSDSNVTRVYGSHPADVGRAKVDVLADHLRAIARDVDVLSIQSKVTVHDTAQRLVDADLVFGCTDDNAGRLVLSRLATYCLLPVIDCGVILTGDRDGRLDGVYGRVTVLYPGAACLVCRGRIDFPRAAAEALTPEEHATRLAEGYAPALPGVEPAVVAYTTMVGSQAVGELLERLTRYGPSPVPNEVILRMHEREFSTNIAEPREHHYCHPQAGKLGLGVTDPFLEQTWGA